MIFLKILGWVLLSILALIVILLFIRVRIIARYSGEQTSVEVKWLFFTIPVYPQKKKTPKDGAAKPETPPDAAAEQPEAPADGAPQPGSEAPAKKQSFLSLLYGAEGVDGIILLIKRIFSYLGTFLGNFLRAPVIDDFQLEICCTRSDAASTAVFYGEVCTAVFPMLGSLASSCRIKKYDVNIYPDFIARFSEASFYVNLHITPIYLVGISLSFALKLLFNVLLRVLVKIFLPKKSKASDKTGKENIITEEKSVISNE